MSLPSLRRIRPWVQAGALILVLSIFLWSGAGAPHEAGILFNLDPLIAAVTWLSTWRLPLSLALGSLAVVLVTLALGRVWCGWLCPLGTLLDWTRPRRSARYVEDSAPRLRSAKYFVLATILVAALLGNLTLLVLDPLTLFYRTLTAAIWPAFNGILNALETFAYRFAWAQPPVDFIEGHLRGWLLPVVPPVYGAGLLFVVLLAGIVALNAIRPRFWCRYLCPLGALLGLASKVALVRRQTVDACSGCQRCARACPTGTIDPAKGFASDPAECTVCLDCVSTCRTGGQRFGMQVGVAPRQPYDPSRRQFVASTGAALALFGLLQADPKRHVAEATLLRPPGAQDDDFASRCVRCGACLRVCPTSGLQPGWAQTSWGEVWTPVLTPRIGQCDYSCNACGQACPVAAIAPLAPEEKRITVIGHASIDRNRCIPWAKDRNCLVCEEMCPMPEKAIELEDVTVIDAAGVQQEIRRPKVIEERCIGCGICENRCPLDGPAAIRVMGVARDTASA